MSRPVAIIGFGGHGRVVASALRASGRKVIAATVATRDLQVQCLGSKPSLDLLTDIELISRFGPDEIDLVMGIGGVKSANSDSRRVDSVLRLVDKGFSFCGVRHPAAWVADDAIVARTAQIHAGAIVQSGATIGDFAIINTNVSVDHDCRVADHCHLAPGTTLSGAVDVGTGCHLGTGCNVIQGRKIGAYAFVAAGATVVHDVAKETCVRGVPAKPFTMQEN